MPTNRRDITTKSSRLTRLALDVLSAADQLIAEPMNEAEASRHLTVPVVLLSIVLDELTDAIYRVEKLDQSHRAGDLEIARIIAGIA